MHHKMFFLEDIFLPYVKYDKKGGKFLFLVCIFSCRTTSYHNSVTIMQIVMSILLVSIKAQDTVILFVFIKINQLCIHFFRPVLSSHFYLTHL